MRRLLVCTVIVLALWACSSPLAPLSRTVTLTPTMRGYAPGTVVSAALVNRSGGSISYGECSLKLYRLDGDAWIFAGPPPRPCLDIGYALSPGTATVLAVPLEPTAAPGTYRLHMEISPSSGQQLATIRSPAFPVETPP
jgi:hypothetical protein